MTGRDAVRAARPHFERAVAGDQVEVFFPLESKEGPVRRGVLLLIMAVSCAATVALGVCLARAEGHRDPGETGPYGTDYVTINTTNPTTGSELEADIHFPSDGGTVDAQAVPCPAVVFSHGTSAPRAGHTGNAAHLASWGYIVALPDFLDDELEVRASDVQHMLNYLEGESANPSSVLFGAIDTDRFALTGHSLGAMSAFMLAVDDDRIDMSIVPLDPVNPDDQWGYEEEAPDITAPMGLIGSPAQTCNWDARYNDIYPHIGSTHKAKFVIVGGSHCDYLDAENTLYTLFCGFVCGQFSEDRLQLIERYSAAWFNYYVQLDTDYYPYLYGEEAAADIAAGLITRTVDTAPRGVTAVGRFGSVELNWSVYEHPIVAGYNIYRRQGSGGYPTAPCAQVGREGHYVDTDVIPGQDYLYVVRSRDSAGNEHQPSSEVGAAPRGMPVLLSPPDGTVTTTQSITFTWRAGEGPAPEGYNLDVDGTVITTTETSRASLVPVGVHTWTVRAFDGAEYSDWASPAWTVEAIDTVQPPGVPVLLSPPDGTVTTTQNTTLAWQAGEGPAPEGYNLDVDGTVITTTETSYANLMPIGVHTWSVRAFDGAEYSEWASPAWTVEVTETVQPPGMPVLLSPPDGTVTSTQSITFTWRAGEGPAPQAYNLDVDGTVITTTETSETTILSSGLHSWTARAYSAAGASEWAAPRTLRVFGYRIYAPLVQRVTASGHRSTSVSGSQALRSDRHLR
jgi:hypothetical protein